MLQKSIIITRVLMVSLTILSVGMIFIATSSVFAKPGDRVHLSIVRPDGSDRGCVAIILGGQPQLSVSIPNKNQVYDGGTYTVGTTLNIDIHNDGGCHDSALNTVPLTLDAGSFDPTPNRSTTYEAVFTVYN